MNFLMQYEAAVHKGEIKNDTNQRSVLQAFQQLWDALSSPTPRWQFWRKKNTPKGIYLYGQVGIGKTWLMDLFYHSLPQATAKRAHFHQFMQSIDDRLRQLQGSKNPIDLIVKEISADIQVLCLDEFIVQDITQASVLAALLKGLFEQGLVLIATSNTQPDDLYRDGMNRDRFLPAIALLHQHCQIIGLNSTMDYRLNHFTAPLTYLTPLTPKTAQQFEKAFMDQVSQAGGQGEICIQKRMIPYIKRAPNAIWFDFNILCQIPRCQLDYLELANTFSVFYVSDVPCFKPEETTSLLLFMYLVDVLYDQRRQLSLCAAVCVDDLYTAGPMVSIFERTRSRLSEMQSVDYLRTCQCNSNHTP